ncbi:hypothetical protein Tco_0876425 [Tanacetum coccineum]|uniref:Reverse transcriptase domain-containing protein n=1 Tax=Tanacetum coccineum TaxID=301880 RepID=A0ABQ5BTX7_9ASTR
MDWSSKRKLVIICHEKVVRIPLEGDGILRVQGERTLVAAKALMNDKIDEPRISDIPVVQDFTEVFPEDLVGLPVRKNDKLISVSDLVYSRCGRHQSTCASLLSENQGKANVVADALSRKEQRQGERRLQSGNVHAERFTMVLRSADKKERNDRLSPVLWAEIGEGSLIGPELVQETTDKVVVIKEKLQAARDRQKSYADSGRKMTEYEGWRECVVKSVTVERCDAFGEKGYMISFEVYDHLIMSAFVFGDEYSICSLIVIMEKNGVLHAMLRQYLDDLC